MSLFVEKNTRPIRYLSGRYIKYTETEFDTFTNQGVLGGYHAPPFQFGFVIYWDMTPTYPVGSTGYYTRTILRLDPLKYSTCIYYVTAYAPKYRQSGSTYYARDASVRSGTFQFFNDNSGAFSSNHNQDAFFPYTVCTPPSAANQYPANQYTNTEGSTFSLSMTTSSGDILIRVRSKRPDRIKGHITVF